MSNFFQTSRNEQMSTPEISVQMMRWMMVPGAAEAMQGSLQMQFPNLLSYSQAVATKEAPIPSDISAAAPEAASQPPATTPTPVTASQTVELEPAIPRNDGVLINQPSGEIDIQSDRSLDPQHWTREEREARARQLLADIDETSHNFKLPE